MSVQESEALLDEKEWVLVERAAEKGKYGSSDELVREGVLRLVDEVLDEEDHLECPVDECDATFFTERQLNGHLGSSDHARNVKDGEFWCGRCGTREAGGERVRATPRQDYRCNDCDEPLDYTGEQERDARDELRSVYEYPNPDCETDEVLLK